MLIGVVALTFSVGLTACSSGSSKTATTTTTVTTPPATAAPRTTGMTVNLTITGSQPATIQGTKGICSFPSTGQPNTYLVSAADYPQLGNLGSVRVFGSTALPNQPPIGPAVKLYINSLGFISAIANGGISVSTDGHQVDLDTALYGAPSGSFADQLLDPTWTLRGHITGTIRCT